MSDDKNTGKRTTITHKKIHLPPIMKHLYTLFLGIILSIGSLQAQTPDDLKACLDRLHRAERSHDKDSLAVAHADLADYYSNFDADSMFYHVRAGLEYADPQVIEPYLRLLNNEGNYYNATGASRACVDKFLFATREAERLKADPTTLGDTYSSLGVAYRRIDRPDSAAIYYKQALAHYKASPEGINNEEIPFLLTNIAILYTNTHRLEEASKYIGRALTLSQGLDDLPTELYISNTAGSIYTLLHQYDKAIRTLKQSLSKAQKANMPRYVMQCMTPLLVLFVQTDDNASFEKYNAEAQKWLQMLPPASNEAVGYHEVLATNYARQKQYTKSNEEYQHLIDLHSQNAHTPLPSLHLHIAHNYAAMQQPQKAYEHYERTLVLIDSLRTVEIDHQISDLNVRYETQTKELELAQLQRSYLTHKNRVMQWSILGLFVFGLTILLLIYQQFRHKQLMQKEELNVARSFIEGLEKERSRLSKELHDGVANDLLGIGMMLKLLDNNPGLKDDILDNIETIRNDVRNISHELCRPRFQHTSLDEVMEHLLHQIIGSNDIDIHFHKSGLPALWEQIPEDVALETYRILQELMSNIVRHSEATYTLITTEVTDHSLQLRIENDGKTYSTQSPTGDGIGLYSVDDRVKAIGAQFDCHIADGKQEYLLYVEWGKAI